MKSYKLSVPVLKTDRDSEDLAKLNEIDGDLILRQLSQRAGNAKIVLCRKAEVHTSEFDTQSD